MVGDCCPCERETTSQSQLSIIRLSALSTSLSYRVQIKHSSVAYFHSCYYDIEACYSAQFLLMHEYVASPQWKVKIVVPRYYVQIGTRLSPSIFVFRRGEGRAWERGYEYIYAVCMSPALFGSSALQWYSISTRDGHNMYAVNVMKPEELTDSHLISSSQVGSAIKTYHIWETNPI